MIRRHVDHVHESDVKLERLLDGLDLGLLRLLLRLLVLLLFAVRLILLFVFLVALGLSFAIFTIGLTLLLV